jgi:hypothetical protein
MIVAAIAGLIWASSMSGLAQLSFLLDMHEQGVQLATRRYSHWLVLIGGLLWAGMGLAQLRARVWTRKWPSLNMIAPLVYLALAGIAYGYWIAQDQRALKAGATVILVNESDVAGISSILANTVDVKWYWATRDKQMALHLFPRRSELRVEACISRMVDGGFSIVRVPK